MTMRTWKFSILTIGVAAILFVALRLFHSYYVFYAGYLVLQAIVLAVAWNILGGYTGYTNFGVSAFLALGAYTGVALSNLYPQLPLPVLMLAGGAVSGLIGYGMGYLTMRMKGIYFAICTLALSIVAQTLITNWDYVGGTRGTYAMAPRTTPGFGNYIEYMFLLMLVLVVIVIITARTIEHSRTGDGFAAVRDDEVAAEATGVPTLRLKLIATTLSGAFMGMAGAPFPYYAVFLEPSSAFSLSFTVNAIAMAMIGGTASWLGPFVGAVLLGTVQQIATVTISSEINLLIVGAILVGFVVLAPKGIIGLFARRRAVPS
jgi:branched-chain amino acid transport system permease protein